MRRILALCGLAPALAFLALAGGQPARAFPLGQRAPLLTPGACANAIVKVDFTANDGGGLYCLNGTRYPSFAAMPGATVTRASSKTCQASSGAIVTVPANVLCVTDLGALIEEARTNSFLNSAVGATQSVTTTAAPWTLSFYGAGSIVLSGACTGTLNGTGASARASLTATCTAGATTLTVTGPTTSVQFEAGGASGMFGTSYIPTTSVAVTRPADSIAISGVPLPVGPWTMFVQLYYPLIAGNQVTGGLVVDDGPAGNNGAQLWMASSARPRITMGAGAVGTYDSSANFPFLAAPVTVKMAASYDGGKITAQAQGISLMPALAESGAAATNRFALGVVNGAGAPTNGYVQRAALYGYSVLGLTN